MLNSGPPLRDRYGEPENATMIKSKELGRMSATTGDIVCFSLDSVRVLADKLKLSEDVLIERMGGVTCNFNSDDLIAVDEMNAVDVDGKVYPVVMIGAPQNIKRFLQPDEQTLKEFLDQHPRRGDVGAGADFNRSVYNEIVQEYRQRVTAR